MEKPQEVFLSKKGLFGILLLINPIVTFAINNTKMYNDSQYNVQFIYLLLVISWKNLGWIINNFCFT